MSDSLPPDLSAFLRDELGALGAEGPQAFVAEGPVWVWSGAAKSGEPPKARWYFMTVDGATGEAIRTAAGSRSGGWGSVKVTATIGATRWSTSLFPSASAGGYILPLKAAVRKKEGLGEGDRVRATLAL